MSFFEDEPPAPPVPSARDSKRGPRKPGVKRSKRSVRIQRLIVLLVALFVIVFLLALWIRSCTHNRKVSSYQEYLSSVQKAVDATDQVGKTLKTMVTDPTSFTRDDLLKALDKMVQDQEGVVARVQDLQPPKSLETQHDVLIEGMQVRARGMRAWRDALNADITGQDAGVTGADLAALGGYFVGPEAYYAALFYTQAQKTMADEGVTNVTVPTADFYTRAGLFTTARMKEMLTKIGKSANIKGIHGVALVSVTVQPGDKKLQKGKRNNVTATADLVFVVSMQNQGNVTEKDVPVRLTLDPPGDVSPQTVTQTIGSIKSQATKSVQFEGLTIDSSAIGRVSKLTVKVGPVPQEQVTGNNSASYSLVLQL